MPEELRDQVKLRVYSEKCGRWLNVPVVNVHVCENGYAIHAHAPVFDDVLAVTKMRLDDRMGRPCCIRSCTFSGRRTDDLNIHWTLNVPTSAHTLAQTLEYLRLKE